MTESFLVVIIAALVAFTLVELTLPQFNQMMDRQLSFTYGSQFMLMTSLIILSIGLLSGLYPALFIASFSAKRVLSGDLIRGGTAIFIRKLTLCFQGALSIGLIIATASLYQQMNLINNLEVGYEKSSRLTIKALPFDALYKKDNNSLFTALKNLPGVDSVTASNTDLTNDMNFNLDFTWPNGNKLSVVQPSVVTSYDPVKTLGLTLLAGRDFSPQFSGDWYQEDAEGNRSIGVIVSRHMAELAGYQDLDSVIGLTLMVPNYGNMKAKVVGVIENVKIGSARQETLPMSLNLGYFSGGTANLVIKANNVDMARLSKQVQQIITKELHLSDANISQLTDDYANAHKNEQRALDMVTVFSLLAIFLTCLGTFGLASFSTLRRQKEVAMRKVLGATRLSIVNLLAKEFLLLVSLSILIAFPLSYWLLNEWLANFNERIIQSFWVYLAAAVIITAITWLTVASLAFRAANSRPSLILRDE
jgi:putative ABC transport system permease protein